ncbi:hypothetical protein [Botrimarina hoheduenensis]|uniref:Uncharacterized protein n=1 Tax=Botrimarina hoheduenensis TaxID=2528000 RepID=A0A5C5W9X3_9BACT|nr:hypothetical protein [Botrimarina hoheduenensis]TWT46831.1 hypothetical protein Pla111_19330 [Botrimarina hoheduenensis]
MKIYQAAIAAALMASGVGCATMSPCGSSIDPGCCGVPGRCGAPTQILDGRCQTGPGIFDRLGWTRRGVECGEMMCLGDGGCAQGACGCGPGPCGPGGACGMGGACGNGQNSMTGCVNKLLDCNGMCGGGDRNYNFNPGPPTGQVAYPYYTTRGPRDFLMANPPSIGPR